MSSVQEDHWNFIILRLSISLLLLLFQNTAFGLKNENYNISTLCNGPAHPQIYKRIDGIVLTSEVEGSLECVITFHTESILQTFMLRFEHLALDCNDHLYIFDGAYALGDYKAALSCRSTLADVGTIFTQSNFATLKYHTDNWRLLGNDFKLVITAIRKPVVHCNDFSCLNDLCISRDLICDSVNHCGDNSDETDHAVCSKREYRAVIGEEAIIPCNVTSMLSNDQVTLVIWFKVDSAVPIYSVDKRQAHTGDARHFVSEQLGSRANVNMGQEEATLAIKPVRQDDGGEYRCRVDFRRSRTKNIVMKLIIVAPESTESLEAF